MCQPTAPAATADATTQHNVVICGAGPAGLLAAILLLRRNGNPGAPRYRVTLVDPGTDYGKLDADGLNRARSWMIGLSSHGLSAIREVPGLYENYIHGLGIDITKAVFGLSRKLKFELNAKDILPEDSAFTVDRNYICAALSRYLNEQHGDDEMFLSHYHTRALFVDGDNKCVMARQKKDGDGDSNAPANDISIAYDILLGCDGIRSIVRNAFLTKHRDFEFDLRGTFGYGKSVHVALPEGMDPGTFMFVNEALPNFGSFILPETGNKLNVALGTALNKECAPELKSDDAKVVADYFRKHWHAFEIDSDEAGRQWVGQGWNTISQVHCNFYHSETLGALLLGDAAHATSPQIGQGMNTALADAAALNRLLEENKDDWSVVLPKFSAERVKEGHALTDLSFYTFSLSARQQLTLMLRQNIRRTLNGLVPWLVDPDPMSEVSKGMRLSEAYHRMSKLGVIARVRKVNDGIMRDYFEKETGMVRHDESAGVVKKICIYGIPVVAASMVGAFVLGIRG